MDMLRCVCPTCETIQEVPSSSKTANCIYCQNDFIPVFRKRTRESKSIEGSVRMAWLLVVLQFFLVAGILIYTYLFDRSIDELISQITPPAIDEVTMYLIGANTLALVAVVLGIAAWLGGKNSAAKAVVIAGVLAIVLASSFVLASAHQSRKSFIVGSYVEAKRLVDYLWDSEYKFANHKWTSDERSAWWQPTRLSAYATYEAAHSDFKQADADLKWKYRRLEQRLIEINNKNWSDTKKMAAINRLLRPYVVELEKRKIIGPITNSN